MHGHMKVKIKLCICEVSLSSFYWESGPYVDCFRAGAYDPARKQSTNLYDIYHCWVYSE